MKRSKFHIRQVVAAINGEAEAWVTPSMARFHSELLLRENKDLDGLCLYQQMLKVAPLIAADPQRTKNAFELRFCIN